jgi:preprotein translocase subunit SecA
MSEMLLKPGFRLGCYPQKKETDLSEFEQAASVLFEKLYQPFTRHRFNQNQIVSRITKYEKPLIEYSEADLTVHIFELKEKLVRFGLTTELIAQAFATIRETAARTLGKRHYDVQLYGGWIMMNGMLAEMATGEGKTLTTTLPACTSAMAGIPVHVITANDYLAARDAEIMQPLYQRLGLTAASVIDGMEKKQRRVNYQCHIVHTTNKQIAFDYLRDRIEIGKDIGFLKLQFRQIQHELEKDSGGQLLLKGLCFALIDEADSVLIDEAKTPLIITQLKPNEYGPETYSDALYLATTLTINDDYTVDSKTRKIELTQQGEDKLANKISGLPKHWQHKHKREMLVIQALTANYSYKKDKHYVVQGDKIQIVDEFTGRIMSDRSWEQGLHQMIEAKEGCRITEQRETIARISYQNFFIRYLRLAGTSGTLKEVSSEMHSVYGLQTIKVQPHTPSKRIMMQERIYNTLENKKAALLARISGLYKKNRPILIGTTTVEESKEVGAWLKQAGFPHRVLNATQDRYEAEIIAKAGQQNAITVATNMAGRGTDIELGLGVAKLGGLHVIALNSNESRRIDRQLYGRCARQSDPGSAEAILSLQDPALQHFYSSAMLKVFSLLCRGSDPIPAFLASVILRLPQQTKEKRQRRIRKQVMKLDRQLSRILAFSGKSE